MKKSIPHYWTQRTSLKAEKGYRPYTKEIKLSFMSKRVSRIALLLAIFSGGMWGNDFVPKGAKIGMVSQDPHMRRYDFAYGYSSTLALRASRVEWEETSYHGPLVAQGLQASYVLHRHYTDDGILNVYLIGGPVQVHEKPHRIHPERKALGFEGTVSADYETTQVYYRGTLERLESSISTHQIATVQALYAPWESTYNRPTFWLGVQGRSEKRHHEERSLAPMIRSVSKRWWIDAGVFVTGESRGKMFVSVMYLF